MTRRGLCSILWVCWLCCISSVQFHDISLNDIATRAQDLIGPFASVNSADELWGSHLKSPKCSALVLRVTDFGTLDRYLTTRPQLVLSGELHGDERVGPLSTVFTAEMLVWASQCKIQKDSTGCGRLETLKVTDAQITWLAFLAAKRDTYIMPTPNCMGYLQNQRSDQGVDPNRDFPYSRRDRKCLESNTALIFDALFRNVTVQTLVTFHGGMVAIGYEWGSVQHPRGRDQCPDHLAHSEIAKAFVAFAGGFKGQKPYSAAPINSNVYPVEGGMEDWAYAAGWDVELNVQCAGRPNLATPPPNRAVTFLIETSDRKGPPASELGHDSHILTSKETNQQYGGHVPRNSRLSLVAIDSVQPYLCFSEVIHSDSSPHSLSASWYVGGGFHVKSTWLSWHSLPSGVLSRFSSAQTPAERSGILEQFVDSLSPPSPPPLPHEKWASQHKGVGTKLSYGTGWLSGNARWNWKDPFDLSEGLFQVQSVPLPLNITHPSRTRDRDHRRYAKSRTRMWHDVRNVSLAHRSRSLDTEPSGSQTSLLLIAWAEVDSDWGAAGQGYPATVESTARLRGHRGSRSLGSKVPFPPQSHLSNARSNPNWREVNSQGAVKVQGRMYFPSDPVVVSISHSSDRQRSPRKLSIDSLVTHCASWDRGR